METYQIQEETAVYYLTFTVIEWLPVFIGGIDVGLTAVNW
jgi:hypothetical protein